MECMCCGPMDLGTFRESMKKGFAPRLEAINTQGLFNEYFFKSTAENITGVLQPSLSVAFSQNPFTKEHEKFVCISMDGDQDGKNHRNPLNLVIVLDISGSMSSQFRSRKQSKKDKTADSDSSSEISIMEIAKKVLLEILKTLKKEDRIGIVLFDDQAEVLLKLTSMADLNLEEIQGKVGAIHYRGNTDMEKGMKAGIQQFYSFSQEQNTSITQTDHDNRIIFLTDANPTTGGGKEDLLSLSRQAAESHERIYTSFIGLGLDFNINLVNDLVKVRGSNYFSVHSIKQFQKVLVEDFNYMVTPLVFNTSLYFESKSFAIAKSYGTDYDEKSGLLQKIDTIIASAKDERGVKGGVMLFLIQDKYNDFDSCFAEIEEEQKLNDNNSNNSYTKIINLQLQYEDREGTVFYKVFSFDFQKQISSLASKTNQIISNDVYQGEGIRKAILLARYSEFLKEIITNLKINQPKSKIQIMAQPYPNQPANNAAPKNLFFLNNHEEEEAEEEEEDEEEEHVDENIKSKIDNFIEYFRQEVQIIMDMELLKELDILEEIKHFKDEEKEQEQIKFIE